jgi:hypothetical protein
VTCCKLARSALSFALQGTKLALAEGRIDQLTATTVAKSKDINTLQRQVYFFSQTMNSLGLGQPAHQAQVVGTV